VGVSQVPPTVSSFSDGGQAPTPVAAVPLKTTTIQRSARNKDKADEHTLHKTSRVAAKKNLEPGTSFTSFSDSHVISNLGRVGFELGQADEIIKASSMAIKKLEIDRLVVLANKKKM